MNSFRIPRSGIAIFILLILLLTGTANAKAEEQEIPRTIIALYDKEQTKTSQSTYIHSMAEMPLNHLGLKVEYYDIQTPLPDLTYRPDVRGVLTWFTPETRLEDTAAYLQWVATTTRQGKAFAVLGNPAIYVDKKGRYTSPERVRKFLSAFGLTTSLHWRDQTYNVSLQQPESGIFNNIDALKGVKPSYLEVALLPRESASVHLWGQKKGDNAAIPLAVTGSRGGYIAQGYEFREYQGKDDQVREWTVNPFQFFRLAYATDNLPKPDTTTLAGRRIYYSHIDGDGWNNATQLEEYKDKNVISSQVVMEKIIKPNPDLPVTVTAIAAELDPAWAGETQSQAVAKAVFSLPNVEAGSHTYSHPFSWDFFADGNWKKEEPYLNAYPKGNWKAKRHSGNIRASHNALSQPDTNGAANKEALQHGYDAPRAYANKPFNINTEIDGSITLISKLLPKGKTVKIVTWPGSTTPFQKALALTREAGVKNINGGDSRFDTEYPNVASVAPIGRQVGNERQIYASTSNENTYTHLWHSRFFGYRYLRKTLENTEMPQRIKPLNIYYHIYSGEKQSSLNAVLENIAYAHKQAISPVSTSNFTAIAEGFYSTSIVKTGPMEWKVKNRGSLATIRFDNKTLETVDYTRSEGVIGARHYQGSLYVYLDDAEAEPVIALTPNTDWAKETRSPYPYLVESRWKVWDVDQEKNSISCNVQGFGTGEMVWQVPEDGKYRIELGNKDKGGTITEASAKNSELRMNLKASALEPISLRIARIE